MVEFRMPSLGADMEAGTLVEWLVKPGDAVKRGDIVAVVETQKGAIEVEIFQDGAVAALLVEPGMKVPVGTPLATIAGAGEPVAPVSAVPGPTAAVPAAPPAPAASPLPGRAMPSASGRVRASPAARRRAAARGVDLGGLAGSGPGGAVVYADVAAGAPARKAGPDLDAMRVAIAAAMARSKREIPHFYLVQTIDMHAVTGWLGRVNAPRLPAERLLAGVLLLKAVALALRKSPGLNGFFEEGRFRPASGIHVGTAVAIRGGGLVAPAIHDADTLSLVDMMAKLRDLVGRVRAGSIRSSEIADPTITVSSLGERGVDALYGVIYPPQVALVGFGRVHECARVVDGAVVARPVLEATLSADHRVSDGHRGALFLGEIDRLLQNPEGL